MSAEIVAGGPPLGPGEAARSAPAASTPSNSPARRPASRRWPSALFIAGCLLLMIVRGGLSMWRESRTADEGLHLYYGERALEVGTFVRDQPMLNSKMPVSVLNALPSYVAGRLGLRLGRRSKLFADRFPSLLLGALLGWLVFHWARALLGWRSGALALLLCTFCPNVLAHARLITTDIGATVGFFASCYTFWRYLEQPRTGRLLAAGAAFGAAQLAKGTGVFLLPIFVLLTSWREVTRWRRERARAAAGGGEPSGGAADGGTADGGAADGGAAASGEEPAGGALAPPAASRRLAARLVTANARPLAVLLVMGLLILNLGFACEGTFTRLRDYGFESARFRALAARPVLAAIPLPLPVPFLQSLDMYASDTSHHYWSYFWGRHSAGGFYGYFLACFLLKVPISTQLAIGMALWLWASGRVRIAGADGFLLLPVIVLGLYFNLSFPMQIGLRYLLPVFPFLFVFASRLAVLPLRSRWGLVLVPLVVWNLGASLWIHPHYLAYFNEAIGGPRNGWHYLIDSNLDWGQDHRYVRKVYAPRSPVPVVIDPDGVTTGRIAVGATRLVGLDPEGAKTYAWLRDNFRPVDTIGYSWLVFDVSAERLRACCPGAWREFPGRAGDLAPLGSPIGGGEDVRVAWLERLNDGWLGGDSRVDSAQTVPLRPEPVRAWFGIEWRQEQLIGSVVAYPSFYSRGRRDSLAIEYVFQYWDGTRWVDIPSTHVTDNQRRRVEHHFPPVRTRRLRISIASERPAAAGRQFRAACLELAAYPP
jgi:hypothetical protein